MYASSECSGEYAHMRIYSPDLSLLADAISSGISCTGPYRVAQIEYG